MSQLLSTKNTASLPAAGVQCVQFLKFKLEYLTSNNIRPFHITENQYPAVCKTAAVMPTRSLFEIPISIYCGVPGPPCLSKMKSCHSILC